MLSGVRLAAMLLQKQLPESVTVRTNAFFEYTRIAMVSSKPESAAENFSPGA